MWSVLGFVVTAGAGLALVLHGARKNVPQLTAHPWVLADTAKLHVPIMGGLAGFAITGLVLITGFQRNSHTGSAAFTTVIVMFLVAYLFYIGNAFLISYLPHDEHSGDFVPRVHFSLASTIEYRTVFVSWFALRPLLDVHGLRRPADVLAVLLPLSLALGSTIVAIAADGLGLIRFRETYFSVAVGTVAALVYAGIVWAFAPGARSEYSALCLTLVIFGVNMVGFAAAALTSLAPRYARMDDFYRRHGRTIVVADMQLTVLSLTLLWLAVVGAV